MRIVAEVKNYGPEAADGYRIRAALYPSDGAVRVLESMESRTLSLPAGGSATDTLVMSVVSPRLWSAEQPNRYRLVLELVGSDGRVAEILGSVVGSLAGAGVAIVRRGAARPAAEQHVENGENGTH